MDGETREWLEGFEKRIDAKVEHGFALVRRDIRRLDERVGAVEQQRPVFVGE